VVRERRRKDTTTAGLCLPRETASACGRRERVVRRGTGTGIGRVRCGWLGNGYSQHGTTFSRGADGSARWLRPAGSAVDGKIVKNIS
jgi:hypothetical protein